MYLSIELSDIDVSLEKVKLNYVWQNWNWTKFGKSEIQRSLAKVKIHI